MQINVVFAHFWVFSLYLHYYTFIICHIYPFVSTNNTTNNNKVCLKAKQKAIQSQAWTSMNTFEMNWNSQSFDTG